MPVARDSSAVRVSGMLCLRNVRASALFGAEYLLGRKGESRLFRTAGIGEGE